MGKGTSTESTRKYPIDSVECVDLSKVPKIEDGDIVLAYVSPVLGATYPVKVAIVYDSKATNSLTFSCAGTTFNYTCSLLGKKLNSVNALSSSVLTDSKSKKAIEASTVCIINNGGYLLKFRLRDLISGDVSKDSSTFPI